MKSKRTEADARSGAPEKVQGLGLDVFGASDRGKVRDQNEDAFVVDASTGIFLVADGVGGHSAGEIASRIVAQVPPVMLIQRLDVEPKATVSFVKDAIAEAMEDLNEQILMQAELNPMLKGMASTVVLALSRPEGVYVAHLGDSRAYLIRERAMSQLTHDHSLVAKLVEAGEITAEEARGHPSRHVVTRVLGQQDHVNPGVTFFEPQEGDRLILCSDGLSDMIADEQICQIALTGREAEKACSGLVEAALEAGGRDNVTVIVARWYTASGQDPGESRTSAR